MDAKFLLFSLAIFAGCSRESDPPSGEAAASERQLSLADASKAFEAEKRKYDKLVEFKAAAVERQKKELDAGDSAKAEESAAIIAKLDTRLADQKEKLDAARRARDDAALRENPATKDDFEKAFHDPLHPN